MPVVNSLMWLEEDSWWHLSALAPESGGEYVATDLVEIARTRLEEYVSRETPWRPIFRIH